MQYYTTAPKSSVPKLKYISIGTKNCTTRYIYNICNTFKLAFDCMGISSTHFEKISTKIRIYTQDFSS